MTQLRTLALGEAVQNVGVQDFQLIIYDPTGQTVQKLLSAHDLNQAGVIDGITSTVRGGACKGMTFTGRPDLIGATGGEIVWFRASDGGAWQDVGYGTVLEGWPTRETTEGKPYVVDADELLRYSIVDNRVYGLSDPANIAANLAADLRHPALKYNPTRFPSTGTTLAGDFNLPGATFLEAFAQLAEAAEEAGRSVSFGVDPAGYIFFEPLSGVAAIPYEEEEFAHLKVDARGLVTSVYWVIGNKPNNAGILINPGVSGAYGWATLTHTSTPNPALHSQLPRPKALQAIDDGSLFVRSGTAFIDTTTFLGWQYNGSIAQTTATNVSGYFSVNPNPGPKQAYGIRLDYRRDYTVTSARLEFGFQVSYSDGSGGVTSNDYASIDLPYSDNRFADLTLIIPGITVPFVNAQGKTATDLTFINFSLHINGPAGAFRFRAANLILLNRAGLDAAARREIKTPAFEPTQLTPRRPTPNGREGYWVPHDIARIRVEGTPYGDVESPVAEIRYTFNEIEGFQSVVDLGNPARSDTGETVETIRLGVERLTSQQEIQIGRRL